MSSGFERFSDGARRALTRAQGEARRLGHSYIDTEHILLGLAEESGTAAKVLNDLGISANKIQAAIEFVIGKGERRAASGELDLAPRAKKVIELAVDEARRLNSSYIGSEHLLLGLLREKDGVACSVLESFGITLERTRDEINRIVRQGAVRARTAGRTATRTPTLDQLGTDLSALARADKLDHVIGRNRKLSG